MDVILVKIPILQHTYFKNMTFMYPRFSSVFKIFSKNLYLEVHDLNYLAE
jgi:hypothetical protein